MTNTSRPPHKARSLVLAMLLALPLSLAPTAAPVRAAEIIDNIHYVFMTRGTDNSMLSGSLQDVERARSLRNGTEPLLYIRDTHGAYVIRDVVYLHRAEAIFRPQQIVGERQGELGRQQGELGKRQGELGRQQGELGRQQAEAPPRLAAELGRKQGELGRQQGELGRQQGELGRRQGELGQEQARLAHEANIKIRALLAEAIQHGAARRVN